MENNFGQIRLRILQGLELSFKRLLEKKSKDNGVLVFCKDGHIVRIKAKDLMK